MPASASINYSLRPNKTIQRSLIFDGIQNLMTGLCLQKPVYVGFGSLWFADFLLAHKRLKVDSMISIESDKTLAARAKFNKPFKSVRVVEGHSSIVVPELLSERRLNARPWIIWLDYDYELNDDVLEELRVLTEFTPENSIVLTTFNVIPRKYGKMSQRLENLRELFGAVVPDSMSDADCNDDVIADTVLDLTEKFFVSVASAVARPGGFIPCFKVRYRDGADMATIGGVLPSSINRTAARTITSSPTWQGMPARRIDIPPLTLKEVAAMQSALPRVTKSLDRTSIRKLGFDLEDDAIEAFSRFYRLYPTFAEVLL